MGCGDDLFIELIIVKVVSINPSATDDLALVSCNWARPEIRFASGIRWKRPC